MSDNGTFKLDALAVIRFSSWEKDLTAKMQQQVGYLVNHTII